MAHKFESNNDKPSLTWTNYLEIAFFFAFRLPFACLQTIVSPFISCADGYNDKPLKRRIGDTVVRMAPRSLPSPVMQNFIGSGLYQYRQWAEKHEPELGMTVEELPLDIDGGRGDRGHLLWIGSKGTQKVILYFPGGAYTFQVTEMMFKFWNYARIEWQRQGLEVAIAVLSYPVGPGPNAAFPIQLFQATQALRYLLSIGYNASDIQLAGDSAGGNLLTQLLSHMVHPFPIPSLVSPLNLPPGTRLRGALMISPWVGFTDPDRWGSSFQTKSYDVTVYQGLRGAGERYINDMHKINTFNQSGGLTSSQLVPYVEAVLAPDDWYSDLHNAAVDRMLVTAGKEERLHDQIKVFFERKIEPYHLDATLLVQDGGVHDDIIMDFAIADKPLGNKLTPVVLEWIAEGFRS